MLHISSNSIQSKLKQPLSKRKLESRDISEQKKLPKEAKVFKKRMMDNWDVNIEPSYKNVK